MVDITLKTTTGAELHGLKSIETYLNLFPEELGRLFVDGEDMGEVTLRNIGHTINLALSHKKGR